MQITLTNGVVLDCLGVHAKQVTYQGVLRDCLIFLFNPDVYSVEEISEHFTTDNSNSIKIMNDSDEYIHSNYTIQVEAGKGYRDMVLYGTMLGSEQAENTEKRVYVKILQTTLAERKLEEQQKIIEKLLAEKVE